MKCAQNHKDGSFGFLFLSSIEQKGQYFLLSVCGIELNICSRMLAWWLVQIIFFCLAWKHSSKTEVRLWFNGVESKAHIRQFPLSFSQNFCSSDKPGGLILCKLLEVTNNRTRYILSPFNYSFTFYLL